MKNEKLMLDTGYWMLVVWVWVLDFEMTFSIVNYCSYCGKKMKREDFITLQTLRTLRTLQTYANQGLKIKNIKAAANLPKTCMRSPLADLTLLAL